MKHLKTVSVAKASTNQGSGGSVGFWIWIGSMVAVLKNFDL